MTPGVNAFGQSLGTPLPGWQPPPFPGAVRLAGRFCRLERLNPDRHAAELHVANAPDDGRMWKREKPKAGGEKGGEEGQTRQV
jgi:hypothetical protein